MRTKEEKLKHIEEVMTEYVDPNVAQHGGKVNVVDFDMDTGTLHLQMSGSCSGCAGNSFHIFSISNPSIIFIIFRYYKVNFAIL